MSEQSHAEVAAKTLEEIRADIVPKMEVLAKEQALPLNAEDFASDADGVYINFGPVKDMDLVPETIRATQAEMHARLNNLVSKLGVISDVTELFDPSTKHNASYWAGPDQLYAGVETNTHDEVNENGGTVARATFQWVPTGKPAVELITDDGSTTDLTETTELNILRRNGEEGDHWLEVTASRSLMSEDAKFSIETDRLVRFFYDPRDPENVLPYLRVTRAGEAAPNLAVAGSEAWKAGLAEIYETIDLIEAVGLPPRYTE